MNIKQRIGRNKRPRVVVYNESQIVRAIIFERCVEYNGVPLVRQHDHTATENLIGIGDGNPVRGAAKARFVGVDKINVIRTLHFI